MLSKGGGVVGVLGTALGVTRQQTHPHPGQPRCLGEAGRDREPRWRRAGWARAHWFTPTAMHLAAPPPPPPAPRSPIPRPPSIRPPHRKLFLINENGKLGPHITSRDVLGSGIGSNGSRRLGQYSPGFERLGLAGASSFLLRPRARAEGTPAPGAPAGPRAGWPPPPRAPRLPAEGS